MQKYLLAADIGNTNIKFGVFKNGRLAHTSIASIARTSKVNPSLIKKFLNL